MEPDILEMTRRDRDQLKVISNVERGRLTQEEGGEQLGLSARQVRRLVQRVREEGDAGVIHRGRGRPSNRRLCEQDREGVKELLRQEAWRDFGPTFAQEQVAKQGYRIGRETVRKMQIELELRKPRKRREVHRSRRERRACFGEMIQMDTSIHDWLEGRGEEMVLISMIDDANSRLRGRFFRSDTTFSNLRAIREWVEEFGRPVALYVDKASHFKVNRPRSLEEDLEDSEPQTQVKRAMQELGVKVICANSPQAKGRVERQFGTLQDRLVKGMRLAGIASLEEANGYLSKEFLPEWEERWTVKPKNRTDAHRPVSREMDLEAIFSVRESRTVRNDYTVQWMRRTFQITKQLHPQGLRGGKVQMEVRVNGDVAIRFKDRYLEFVELEGTSRGTRRHPAPISDQASKNLVAGAIDLVGL